MKSSRPEIEPQRTCLACRQVKSKHEMVRLVFTGEKVEIDSRGKKAGRGAYLCRSASCWEAGLKGDRLEHAFRAGVSRDNREELLRLGQELIQLDVK